MKCIHCDNETSVVNSRPHKDNTIRRQRKCESGHSFTTWESTVNATSLTKSRRKALKNWKSKRDMGPVNKFYEDRRTARNEAKKTGEPVIEIYKRSGLLTKTEKEKLKVQHAAQG